ncbi:MAG: hypothetical protein IH845_04720 [Nanoarchaeota archaeon]|nr:hypothetical protein [Nanoarchaeota archaeon]
MEELALRDYNEEIILKLMELIKVLEKNREDMNSGKECSFTYNPRE